MAPGQPSICCHGGSANSLLWRRTDLCAVRSRTGWRPLWHGRFNHRRRISRPRRRRSAWQGRRSNQPFIVGWRADANILHSCWELGICLHGARAASNAHLIDGCRCAFRGCCRSSPIVRIAAGSVRNVCTAPSPSICQAARVGAARAAGKLALLSRRRRATTRSEATEGIIGGSRHQPWHRLLLCRSGRGRAINNCRRHCRKHHRR